MKQKSQLKKTNYKPSFSNLTRRVYIRAAFFIILIGAVFVTLKLLSSAQDNRSRASTTTELETVTPTPTLTPTFQPDVNHDGKVDVLDIEFIIANWGSADTLVDVNHDGVVNQKDLQIVIHNWGKDK